MRRLASKHSSNDKQKVLVIWQEQVAGCVAMGEVHISQAGKKKGISRATSGKEGKKSKQPKQLLGDAEKAGGTWSNKLRMKLKQQKGLRRHTEQIVQRSCKVEAGVAAAGGSKQAGKER